MRHLSTTIFRNSFSIRRPILAAILLLAAAGVTPAAAASFDGEWNVHIASNRPSCGGGQSVSIGITKGQVASTSAMVTASGRVAEAGAISVTLKSGMKRANGSGRLSGTSGAGTWRGDLCSGTWTAQRI